MSDQPTKSADLSEPLPALTPEARAALLSRLPRAEPFPSPALAAHRARLAEHRATAFIRYTPVVAGFRLRPVSLRTLELLSAFGCDLGRNRFEDLAIFVWVHHPAFGQFSWLRRWLVARFLRWRLSPAWPRAAAFCAFAGVIFTACGGIRRRFIGRPFAAAAWLLTFGRPASGEDRLAAALADARALLARSRLDWPVADDSGAGNGLPCAFAAYVLNLVKGRHPALTADEILDWPLVELVQWLRAIIAEANPKAVLLDAVESSLIASELAPPPAKERAA